MPSLSDARESWNTARRRGIAFARELDKDEEADRQLEIRMAAIELMTTIPSLTIEDVLLKFQTWKDEIIGTENTSADFHPPETQLLLSAIDDLKRLFEANLFAQENTRKIA